MQHQKVRGQKSANLISKPLRLQSLLVMELFIDRDHRITRNMVHIFYAAHIVLNTAVIFYAAHTFCIHFPALDYAAIYDFL